MTQHYMSLQLDLFRYTIPYYVREGKVRLTIGIGCTGGRHRSVAITEYFAGQLRESGMRVIVDHRDLHKDAASGISISRQVLEGGVIMFSVADEKTG